MKKPFALMMVLALSSQAFAQEKKEDPFKDFQYGQRVEIMLRSGFGVSGKLIPYTLRQGDQLKAFELADTKTILLDTSLEYPELGGTKDPLSGKFLPMVIGFERNQVKSVRGLPKLTEEEVVAREKLREEGLARLLTEEANRRKEEARLEEERRAAMEEAAASERDAEAQTAEGELKQKAERLAKAREIYGKYPPSAGWGPDKVNEIKDKTVRHQPLTADESEFLANIADWIWYRDYMREKKTEKIEMPKTEAPKKEEPAPEAPKTEAPKTEEPAPESTK